MWATVRSMECVQCMRTAIHNVDTRSPLHAAVRGRVERLVLPHSAWAGGARARAAADVCCSLGTGYALSVFIPISFVCVVPYEAVRWAMIALATLSSGLFLLMNFRGPIFDVAGAKCAGLRCAVVVHGSVPLCSCCPWFCAARKREYT